MRQHIVLTAIIGILLLLSYLTTINYLDQHEVGIARNAFSGKLSLQAYPGFQLTTPWVMVSTVDTRPMRVCVTSTSRAYNCKLIQFVPSAYREFVLTQGFEYYWLANRLSFNSGYAEEYRGMRDILRGYAYSVKTHPFIHVLEQYGEE